MDIENNIAKIDMLLNDNDAFNEYITNIEKNKVEVDSKLKYKVLDKISSSKPKKMNIYNVLKIAACTIFSIAIWRLVETSSIEIHPNNEGFNTQSLYMNLENKLDKLSTYLLNPMFIKEEVNNE